MKILFVLLSIYLHVQWTLGIPDINASVVRCKKDFPELAPWTHNSTTIDKADKENVPGIKCMIACVAKQTFPGSVNEETGAFMLETLSALKVDTPPYNKVKNCLEFRGVDTCETTWKHYRCAGGTIITAIAKKTLGALIGHL